MVLAKPKPSYTFLTDFIIARKIPTANIIANTVTNSACNGKLSLTGLGHEIPAPSAELFIAQKPAGLSNAHKASEHASAGVNSFKPSRKIVTNATNIDATIITVSIPVPMFLSDNCAFLSNILSYQNIKKKK